MATSAYRMRCVIEWGLDAINVASYIYGVGELF